MQRLLKALQTLQKIKAADKSTVNVTELKDRCFSAMNDDLNTPILIAHLFEGVKIINALEAGKEKISQQDLEILSTFFTDFVTEILGIQEEQGESSDNSVFPELVDMLLQMRLEAKANKDFATSDKIRDELQKLGFTIKDKKDGFDWEYNG